MYDNLSLKDLYKDYFRIGVACEKTGVFHDDRELGNPEKEVLILKHFNSVTFENELKPEYNMGFNSQDATETYLPFVICPAAEYALKWAKENNMSVRGHVLIWHSQCSDEIFCKGYKPEYLDGELANGAKIIDPKCYASRDVMLKRMQSYIYSTLEYMYVNGYGKIIYAWDVANETCEPMNGLIHGMRGSYWFRTIGSDFVYWAFRYTREAVNELSHKYAHLYGIEDENQLSEIQPKLLLCEYNEWEEARKKSLVEILTTENSSHGSIIDEGLIDGLGLQGHLSDDTINNVTRYINTILYYSKFVNEIHITEFDVKALCTNKNREHNQAMVYKGLFEELINLKKHGVNIASITIWGLTDDNACFFNTNPLLFHGDLSPKLAFNGMICAATGETMCEPEIITRCADTKIIDFEHSEDEGDLKPADFGFYSFGYGNFYLSDNIAHSGKYSVGFDNRYGLWGGVLMDISRFKGMSITVEAWVKSKATILLALFEYLEDFENSDRQCMSVDASSGEWTYCMMPFNIPDHTDNLSILFMPMDTEFDKDCPIGESIMASPLFIDDIKITVQGMHDDFSYGCDNVKVRNIDHMPIYFTTKKDSRRENKNSLCVIRNDQKATICLHLPSNILRKSEFTLYAKTKDKVVRIGVEKDNPVQLIEVDMVPNRWTKINMMTEIETDDEFVDIYIETDGSEDLFIDDLVILNRK